MALLTAVLLFMCQTAFAHMSDATAAAAEVAACQEAMEHSAMGDEAAPQAPGVAHLTCDTPKMASQEVQMPVLAVADLPLVAIPIYEQPAIERASVAPLVTGNPCRSPPFTLLHCRLLN